MKWCNLNARDYFSFGLWESSLLFLAFLACCSRIIFIFFLKIDFGISNSDPCRSSLDGSHLLSQPSVAWSCICLLPIIKASLPVVAILVGGSMAAATQRFSAFKKLKVAHASTWERKKKVPWVLQNVQGDPSLTGTRWFHLQCQELQRLFSCSGCME